jgi:hypothetical protein
MRTLILAAAFAFIAIPVAPGQSFDCQSSPCTYTFPAPRGVLGDCEGVSWNGRGFATVDVANGCGFPVTGSRYLRVMGGGPENTAAGVPPAALNGAAAEAYVPVPSGAVDVSFFWDFYNAEGPSSAFNDGMLVDVLDATGSSLALLAFADTSSPLGPCVDTTPCSAGSPGVDLGPTPGPESVLLAPLPAGAAFIRIAVWNGVDDNFPSEGVADGFSFTSPLATYPGTGEDLLLTSAVAAGPAPYAVPGSTSFPDVKTVPGGGVVRLEFRSPLGTLHHQLLLVGFNLLPTGAFPPPDPLLVPLGLHVRPGFGVVTLFGFLPVLLPEGNTYDISVPVGLAGLSLLVQGAMLDPSAANGVLSSTHAHEIRFL